jgi:hypothetical protein
MRECTNALLLEIGRHCKNCIRSSFLAVLLILSSAGTWSDAGELRIAGEKVTVTQLSTDGRSATEVLARYMRIVDKSYPRPAAPRRSRFHRIVAVSGTGDIRMSDGRTVRLSGLACGPALQTMIEPFHGDKGWWIVYELNGAEKNSPVPSAYVWSSINRDDPRHSRDALSSLNDQAALNGWCSPDVRVTGAMFERYKALAGARKILKLPATPSSGEPSATQHESTDR